ncbi:hypothetical protein [Nocardia wallacei]|uniref:hypothetical protein n=1 Tax=Nocardia wallacei TaxID=480035 RepID=UPI002457F4E5|nr:hypothetical protein [Nocardia wallacei]
MEPDSESVRVRLLINRATRAGYGLVRGPGSPYAWILLDIDDGEPIHSAATLDDVEIWLNS